MVLGCLKTANINQYLGKYYTQTGMRQFKLHIPEFSSTMPRLSVATRSSKLSRPSFYRHLQRLRNFARNIILHHEDVIQRPVVSFRPDNVAIVSMHQSRSHSHASARFAHTPVQHINNSQRLCDISDWDLFTLEIERGRWRRNHQARDVAEPLGQLLSHAIGEFLFFHSLSQVKEWQYGDGILWLRNDSRRRRVAACSPAMKQQNSNNYETHN